jgi:hypothetical protein
MLCVDNIGIWELNESTSEKTFQRVITVCKDSELNVISDKCFVMEELEDIQKYKNHDKK